MYKAWIMGLKQHDIIKCKCLKIYVSHTNLITSSSCVNETKHDCKTVKNKSQLKVKEDEQNPEKNTGKGIQVPPPSPIILPQENFGKPQTQARKMYQKLQDSAYLKFKGYIRHVQKGHPTLVTQVDLILQNWWEFKVLMTIHLSKLSSCTHLLWYMALFTLSHFLPKILENLW